MSLTSNHPCARQALLGAAVLCASSGALAVPVAKTMQFDCPLPVIGTQTMAMSVRSDMPVSVLAGQPTESFATRATATPSDTIIEGLMAAGWGITGISSAEFSLLASAMNQSIFVPMQPGMAFPGGPVEGAGAFPSITFGASNTGAASIHVEQVTLQLVAPPPEDGTYQPGVIPTVNCALVAGADSTLHPFEILPDPSSPAHLAVDTEAVDFGTLQEGIYKTLSVNAKNVGGAPLVVTGVSIEGEHAAAFSATNDCATLMAGASCAVNVTYRASGDGVQNALLVLNTSDAEVMPASVNLVGKSEPLPRPDIDVSATSLDFGRAQLGMSLTKALSLSNTGTAELQIESISLSDSAEFALGNECTSLAPGSTCQLQVIFTPVDGGFKDATLTIKSNDPDEAAVLVSLNGLAGVTEPAADVPLTGFLHLAKAKAEAPVTGVLTPRLDLITGNVEAQIALNPTQVPLPSLLLGSSLAADLEFEPVGQAQGTLADGKLVLESRMYLKMPAITVRLFGQRVSVGGGANCRTAEPVTVKLETPEGEYFSLVRDNNLAATFTLPAFKNCGLIGSVLQTYLQGSGNTLGLVAAMTDDTVLEPLSGRVHFPNDPLSCSGNLALEVSLLDVSIADGPAKVVAKDQPRPVQANPMTFQFGFDPHVFAGNPYLALQAVVRDTNTQRVLYRTVQSYPVTEGNYREPHELTVASIAACNAR